jgi:mRNA guanylyltransferase
VRIFLFSLTMQGSGHILDFFLSRLKWKAPSENSIDFKLELRFPAILGHSTEPDYTAKPVFILNAYHGDDRQRQEPRYEYFDIMEVDDSEWER